MLDYARLRAKIGERERAQARSSRLQRRQAANDALSSLRRGDIITITHGRRGGLAVVLEPDRDSTDPRPLVLTENRWAGRISSADYSDAAAPLGSMTLPKRVEHRQPRVRRDVASALRSAAAGLTIPSRKGRRGSESHEDPELRRLRDEIRHHPAHGSATGRPGSASPNATCGSSGTTSSCARRSPAATNSLARTFDRIVGLAVRAAVYPRPTDGALRVTDDGRLLARIYSRERPAGGRVPAHRGVARSGCRRAGRGRVGGRVRVARRRTGRHRRGPATFRPPRCAVRWQTPGDWPPRCAPTSSGIAWSPAASPTKGSSPPCTAGPPPAI